MEGKHLEARVIGVTHPQITANIAVFTLANGGDQPQIIRIVSPGAVMVRWHGWAVWMGVIGTQNLLTAPGQLPP